MITLVWVPGSPFACPRRHPPNNPSSDMEPDQRQKDVCPPGEAGQCGQDGHILLAHGGLREQFRLPSNQRAAVRVSIAHQIYFNGGTFLCQPPRSQPL